MIGPGINEADMIWWITTQCIDENESDWIALGLTYVTMLRIQFHNTYNSAWLVVSCDMIHLLTVSVLVQYDVLLTEEYAGLLVKFYRLEICRFCLALKTLIYLACWALPVALSQF